MVEVLHTVGIYHSLVTPIDWKRLRLKAKQVGEIGAVYHSLVTPIDWKPGKFADFVDDFANRHHSLVTPIDWKLFTED